MAEYCIYTDRTWDSGQMNEEHIIPESLGGSRLFSIRVHGKTNSDWGSKIDAPFIANPVVGKFRLGEGIKTKRGELPKVTYKNIAIGDRPIPDLEARVSGSGTELAAKQPIRRVQDSPRPVYRAIVTKETDIAKFKKQIQRGLGADWEIEELATEVESLPPADISANVNVSGEAVFRFFAKVGLGAAYWVLGDNLPIVASPGHLRNIILNGREGEDSIAEVQMNVITPSASTDTRLRHARLFPKHHVVILDRRKQGTVLWIGLFGFFGAVITISPLDLFTECRDNRGLVVVMNWKSKGLFRIGLSKLENRLGVPVEALF